MAQRVNDIQRPFRLPGSMGHYVLRHLLYVEIRRLRDVLRFATVTSASRCHQQDVHNGQQRNDSLQNALELLMGQAHVHRLFRLGFKDNAISGIIRTFDVLKRSSQGIFTK